MTIQNEYAQRFGRLYADVPKAVFAAVAASYCSSGGDNMDAMVKLFLEEWETLHENGIVPQPPPRRSL